MEAGWPVRTKPICQYNQLHRTGVTTKASYICYSPQWRAENQFNVSQQKVLPVCARGQFTSSPLVSPAGVDQQLPISFLCNITTADTDWQTEARREERGQHGVSPHHRGHHSLHPLHRRPRLRPVLLAPDTDDHGLLPADVSSHRNIFPRVFTTSQLSKIRQGPASLVSSSDLT